MRKIAVSCERHKEHNNKLGCEKWKFLNFKKVVNTFPTIMIVFFFIKLIHKFFILIHYTPVHVSSTIVLIFRRTIVLTQHLVSSLSLGDCSVHRLQVLSDKSLARPGRKQSRKYVRDARDFNNIETRAVKFFFFFCKARRRREFTPF